ncbi:hypothetical protein [Ktedonobacter racemifer]|nr:hypothetical protein [Ktedonobacter racemifer]
MVATTEANENERSLRFQEMYVPPVHPSVPLTASLAPYREGMAAAHNASLLTIED